MNGTAASDLLEGYRAAMEAVANAQDALRNIEFNQRDYYVSQDTAAWDNAVDEMRSRHERLGSVRQELEAVAMHCAHAVAEKEARQAEMQKRLYANLNL
jgi:hypothetical protein